MKHILTPALLAALVLQCGGARADETIAAPGRPHGDLEAVRRGWHFYDDPAVVPPEPAPVKSDIATSDRGEPEELRRFRALQKQVEDTRAIAIMRPTEPNIRRYMELEAKVVRNASLFADIARRIAWSDPDLDPQTQGRPVNAAALDAYEREQSSQRNRTLAQLGKDHALLFFFRGDCPYCHAFAPILDAFRRNHGLPVLAVSVDGGGIEQFPDARPDNGITRTLKVGPVPAVYLAQPGSGRVMPVGFGVLSEAQLMERIVTLTTSGKKEAPEAALLWSNEERKRP